MSHLCGQEREHPRLVRRWLSWNHTVLGRVIPGGWVGDGGAESSSALQPFRIPSVIRPERCTCYIFVR